MRIWKGREMESGSIHCLGNGKMAVYGQGPDLIQVFGPPYSSPSFMQMQLLEENGLEVRSEREPGTAIWNHRIFKAGRYIGIMTDLVDSQLPCFIRRIRLEEPLDFLLLIREDIHIADNRNRFEEMKLALLAYAEAGIYIYGKYPSPWPVYQQVLAKGAVIPEHDGGKRWKFQCLPGESMIYMIGGPDYPACIQNTEEAVRPTFTELLIRTRRWWDEFTRRRKDFDQLIPQSMPLRDTLLRVIDDVSILIKSQQDEEGGVLAGHNYHLGYVRDQYGVSRCLLALGYMEEAKAILDFYWRIWKKHGVIRNAQAMGVDGIFHIHENDDVEITGYLIIQAFDYGLRSGDEVYIAEIFTMLEWAWNAQKKHLIRYMLPFNGDETYVAGGILPRSTLNDGSAEATMLFITGGERLLKWIEEKQLWSREKLHENQEILEQVRSHYRDNFWEGDRLVANNSDRCLGEALPRFRHGVCEADFSFGWTERDKDGRYVCSKCFGQEREKKAPGERYYLQSVSLMPLYIGSSLFTKEEIRKMVDEIVLQYKTTGKLPSRPEGNRAVGYDYGLLLYSLTELASPFAREIYKRMLSLVDDTGAWVEYYEDHQPQGTRYRPWESGINLEAALYYAMKGANQP
ncbi:MAG: hypothetical protein ACOX6S_02205 [Clostridia bacterium]